MQSIIEQIEMYKGAVLLIVILFSCQQKNTETNKMYPGMEGPNTKHLGELSITYGYEDASVPPEDHRSYTIQLTNENYRLVVDSYGEIIKDTTLILTDHEERVEQVLDAFKKCKIKNIESKSLDLGCSGGDGEFIKIIKEGKLFFYGSNYYCAGNTIGDLEGDINSFVAELKKGMDKNMFDWD